MADGEALALAAAKEEKKKRDAAVKKLRADLTKVRGELVRAQTENLHLKDLRDCMLDDIGYNKVGQNWAVNEFRARGVELEFSDDGKWTAKDVPAAATPVRSGRAASKPAIGRAQSRP